MELIILKNGSDVIARTEDYSEDAEYSLLTVDSLPEFPEETPGAGHYWQLALVDGELVWRLGDRPLTDAEKVEQYENSVPEWRPGISVVADVTLVLYDGDVYLCRQSHTTQADWTPDLAPALWLLWPAS